MKQFISNICLMALAIAYFFIAHTFIQAMESTKIADLGYNEYDVVCLAISIVFWLSGCGTLAFTAWLNRNGEL